MHKNALNRTPHIKYKLLFLLNEALEAMELCGKPGCGPVKHAKSRGSYWDKDPEMKAGLASSRQFKQHKG